MSSASWARYQSAAELPDQEWIDEGGDPGDEPEAMMESCLTTKEILQAARERFAGHWTKGAMARNEQGECCPVNPAVGAVRWCAYGALRSVTDFAGAADARGCLEEALGGQWLSVYNDFSTTTEADVLALFDHVIASLDRDGSGLDGLLHSSPTDRRGEGGVTECPSND